MPFDNKAATPESGPARPLSLAKSMRLPRHVQHHDPQASCVNAREK
jgi:hypothetical protein